MLRSPFVKTPNPSASVIVIFKKAFKGEKMISKTFDQTSLFLTIGIRNTSLNLCSLMAM